MKDVIIMTRDDEIQKAKKIFYASSDDYTFYNKSFEEGAKWADEHPSVDTVKKIICYALRFTNIMLADNLEEGVEWELLIKKAMEE